MRRISKLLATVATMLALVAAFQAQAELAIIAHPSSKAVGASKGEVAKVYLGRSKTLSGSISVEPVDQEAGNASRTGFYQKVVGKSEGELKRYWSKRMFTGKGKPPPELSDDEAVKAWVAKNPNALGYIDGQFVDSSVKVLLILP